jgi:hypothetical protein
MWCESCTTPAQRASCLCHHCHVVDRQCHHCDQVSTEHHRLLDSQPCGGSHCTMRIRFCTGCVIIPASSKGTLCKACWYAEGELCISCRARKGQRNLDKYRLCVACKNRVTCGSCESAPVSAKHPPLCKRCSKRSPTSAMWCVDHCTEEEIRSGLCRPHFNEGFSPCDSCNALICIPDLVRSICSGKKCREEHLRYEVHACVDCAEALPSDSLVCSDCFSHSDRVCIVCRDKPAQ